MNNHVSMNIIYRTASDMQKNKFWLHNTKNCICCDTELTPVVTSPVAIPDSEGQDGLDPNTSSRYQDTSSRHHLQNTYQNTVARRKSPSSSRRAGSSSRPNSPQRAPLPVLVQAQIEDPPQPLYPRQRSTKNLLYENI